MKLKKIEEGIIPIYENEKKERLIDARELHNLLESKRKFTDWIKQRIVKYNFLKNQDFITFHKFVKRGEDNLGTKLTEYYITIDMAKELCMIENNETGRKIRMYFIDAEKRYREIINNPSNIFDFMRLALNEIEKNEIKINDVENIALDNKNQIKLLKEKIHSNLIGAIARQLGFKISYKHFYEDEDIAIIKDLSKNEYWQVYFKPQGVKSIIDWFNQNKEIIYYEIQYVRNTKNGKKGEIKERGYKIDEVCYKIF